MAKYTKPNYAEQWASAGNIVAPNSAKIQAGHIVEKPNYEYMNWLQNRLDSFHVHLTYQKLQQPQ